MSARNQNFISKPQVEGGPCDYPDALFQELHIFHPSPALQQLTGLLSETPVDLKKLGQAAQGDPTLAAEAVRFCNSSLFGLSRPISTLEQAVVATDADIVRALLLTCWLAKLTSHRVTAPESRVFWKHSLLVARVSRCINDWAGLAQPEKAFLAGLLHDVGTLPFLTLLSRVAPPGKQNLHENLTESIDFQRLHFRTDHCELGERLCTILNFPLLLAEVVSRHHQRIDFPSGFPLLSVVSCAEAIAQFHLLYTNQELTEEAIVTFLQDTLQVWLPGQTHPARLALLAVLKTDLLADLRDHGQSTRGGPHDSLLSTEVHSQAHGEADANGYSPGE